MKNETTRTTQTKFRIPENTEFIEQTMENGMLVTRFIPKEVELKDLDCYKIKNSPNDNWVIFKNNKFAYVVITASNTILENNGCYNDEDEYVYSKYSYTFVTREEMQSELEKHGKVFDFDNKVLKDLRWRAKEGCYYYYMDYHLTVKEDIEVFNNQDDICFERGNYFRTEKECQEFCDKVKSLLK